MKSMKMDKEEMKQEYKMCSPEEAPLYPYGLKIDLCKASLEKLGIKEMPEVGQKMMINALVEVCSVCVNEYSNGENHSNVVLQITDMELSPLTEKKPASKMLYGEDMED